MLKVKMKYECSMCRNQRKCVTIPMRENQRRLKEALGPKLKMVGNVKMYCKDFDEVK